MNAKHILLSALTAFAALSLSASENNVKVVAHMGYWRAPGSAQNSIDAMVQAAKAGFDGTEFDVCCANPAIGSKASTITDNIFFIISYFTYQYNKPKLATQHILKFINSVSLPINGARLCRLRYFYHFCRTD